MGTFVHFGNKGPSLSKFNCDLIATFKMDGNLRKRSPKATAITPEVIVATLKRDFGFGFFNSLSIFGKNRYFRIERSSCKLRRGTSELSDLEFVIHKDCHLFPMVTFKAKMALLLKYRSGT